MSSAVPASNPSFSQGMHLVARRSEAAQSSAASGAGTAARREAVDEATAPTMATAPATAIHHLFEAQARRTPAAVAVLCGDQWLTYAELDRRGNAVAERLRGLGIRAGTCVGLHVERSLDLAVGLLGVLKSGGAYVPFDPVYPADRLTAMAADANIAVLLSQRALAGQLPASWAPVIYLDDMPACVDADSRPVSAEAASSEDASVEVSGRDLAYVMFTSGSTGRPNGVMIEHGGVVNTLLDINERFGVGPGDRVLALSSYGFDLSVYDFFGMWAVGGSVVIPDADAAREPAHWEQLLAKHAITIWNSVPAAMSMLVGKQQQGIVSSLESLRLVMLSGDWIPLPLPDQVRVHCPRAEVVSLGGATEASIWSILYVIGALEPQWKSIPYGRAMLNQTMEVLDDGLAACPVGEVGQIHIGGVGLARGYLNRPELTAQRFIADPRGPSGARLYATGDLGRLLADGTIEFLGRIDGQVKIRGYRVEIGEVEVAIGRHPAVEQAVVVAKDVRGHKQLVAYVTSTEQPGPTPAALRQFLQQTLPDYLVPTHFVVLDLLPLSANQKVDRQALVAAPLQPIRSAKATVLAARNDTERRLVALWQACFELDWLSVDDDFFELGGDSLLAARMFAEIERDFGRALSLDLLLESPTIGGLATLLQQSQPDAPPPSLVTIQQGTMPTPLFCLPGIGGNVLEFRAMAKRLGPEYTLLGIRPTGFEGHLGHQWSVPEIAAQAIKQMRALQPRGPYYLAGYSCGGVLAFEIAQQLTDQGEKVATLALLDSDLSTASPDLSLAERLRLHLRTLWTGADGGRWSYLCSRFRLLTGRLRRGNLQHAEDDVLLGLDLTPASREAARLHLAALRNYHPRVYNGRITLFVTQQTAEASRRAGRSDPTLGWSRWTREPIEMHLAPGTHAEILQRKELQLLAQKLHHAPGGEAPPRASSSLRPALA